MFRNHSAGRGNPGWYCIITPCSIFVLRPVKPSRSGSGNRNLDHPSEADPSVPAVTDSLKITFFNNGICLNRNWTSPFTAAWTPSK
jgi:hypothetical protein